MKKRLTQLDGLRAIAFLLVFAYHALDVWMMWIGVDLFFVLSGMLITDILISRREEPDYFRDFYFRRALRILPPYLLTLALAPLVLGFRWEGQWPWYYGFVSNVLTARGADVHVAMTPLWSLAIEEQFYLVWPFVVSRLSAAGLRRLCWALILLAPVCRIAAGLATGRWEPAYALIFCRMDLLAAGSLLTVERRRDPAVFARFSTRGLWLAAGAGLALLGTGLLVPSFRQGYNSPLFNGLGYSLLAAVMTGTIAYFMLPRRGVLHRALAVRPLVYLGSISYTLYLVHMIVNDVFFRRGMSHGQVAVLGLAAAVLWATLSWYGMEKPLQRFKGRFRRRGR